MKCPRCKKEIKGNLTKDHIVSQLLGKLLNKYGIEFNTHSSDNIEYVCAPCNSSRGHKAITKQEVKYVDMLFDKNWNKEITLSHREMTYLRQIKEGFKM